MTISLSLAQSLNLSQIQIQIQKSFIGMTIGKPNSVAKALQYYKYYV
jgi:hypothetical protein